VRRAPPCPVEPHRRPPEGATACSAAASFRFRQPSSFCGGERCASRTGPASNPAATQCRLHMQASSSPLAGCLSAQCRKRLHHTARRRPVRSGTRGDARSGGRRLGVRMSWSKARRRRHILEFASATTVGNIFCPRLVHRDRGLDYAAHSPVLAGSCRSAAQQRTRSSLVHIGSGSGATDFEELGCAARSSYRWSRCFGCGCYR